MAAISATELRREFLLDPEVAFLNHGSFGACPRPVFERYRAWQRELELEPVDFLARRLPGLLDEARAALAGYLGCAPQDLAFVQNATTGVNLAARSLDLRPGDEILTTDLEYGACDLAWDWICKRTGAHYVRAPIPLPLRDPSEVVEALFAAASERTRAVYVSHVTSEAALVLPVNDIVTRARELGLVTIVDGAHAPAQVPLDLAELGSRLLQRELSQMAHVAQGRGLPARPTRAPGARRRRNRQLGLHRGSNLLRADRDAGDVRPRSLARRSRCDPLSGRARLGLCHGTLPPSHTPSPRRPLRAAGNGTDRAGRDARADGDRPASPFRSGSLRQALLRDRVEIPLAGAENDLLRLSVAAYTTREEIDRLLAALVRELDAEHGQQDE